MSLGLPEVIFCILLHLDGHSGYPHSRIPSSSPPREFSSRPERPALSHQEDSVGSPHHSHFVKTMQDDFPDDIGGTGGVETSFLPRNGGFKKSVNILEVGWECAPDLREISLYLVKKKHSRHQRARTSMTRRCKIRRDSQQCCFRLKKNGEN